MKKILVINLARLGDIVQAAPMLQALKRQYPDASVTMLVNSRFSEVCSLMPWVDETVAFDFGRAGQYIVGDHACIEFAYDHIKQFYELLKKRQFNRVINITPHYIGIFSALLAEQKTKTATYDSDWPLYYMNVTRHWNTLPYHMADLYKKIAGLPPGRETSKLHVDGATARWAEQFLYNHGFRDGMQLIGFHTGASTKEKQWPAEYFRELGEKIIDTMQAKIILYGSKSQNDISDYFGTCCINAQGRTTISQLASLMQRTNILVTNDTGPMHIAAACGTKTISIHMGKEMCRTTGPYGVDCIAVQPRLACHPCEHPEQCPQRTCLNCISPELVFSLLALCNATKRTSLRPSQHSNLENAAVFISRYDNNNLLDYYPCMKTEMKLEDICYRLLRIIWENTLRGGNNCLPIPAALKKNIQELVDVLKKYYQLPSLFSLKEQWRALQSYLETIAGYSREGIQLSQKISAYAAAPSCHVASLQKLSQQLETLDWKIMGYGETIPELATLSHMFFIEKEHLEGDDITTQARHTLQIYENLCQRSLLMQHAGRDFINCCTENTGMEEQENSQTVKHFAEAQTNAA